MIGLPAAYAATPLPSTAGSAADAPSRDGFAAVATATPDADGTRADLTASGTRYLLPPSPLDRAAPVGPRPAFVATPLDAIRNAALTPGPMIPKPGPAGDLLPTIATVGSFDTRGEATAEGVDGDGAATENTAGTAAERANTTGADDRTA